MLVGNPELGRRRPRLRKEVAANARGRFVVASAGAVVQKVGLGQSLGTLTHIGSQPVQAKHGSVALPDLSSLPARADVPWRRNTPAVFYEGG